MSDQATKHSANKPRLSLVPASVTCAAHPVPADPRPLERAIRCALDFLEWNGSLTEAMAYIVEHHNPRSRLGFLVYALGAVLDFGARKYAPNNWRRGRPVTEWIDAALRHLTAATLGEEMDAESGMPHTWHALCELLFAVEQQAVRPDLDDRYTGA